jgi:ABC-type proline/glycine betaine transport system permease subunit
MSIVDWLILFGSGVVATVVVLIVYALIALLRWWFGADRREARS